MASWPVNPVGNLFAEVYSSLGGIGTDCSAGFNPGSTQQTVSDVNIIFNIGIEYYDHSTFSGLGYFSAELFKITSAGAQSVDYENKYLPTDQKPRNGHWWDTLALSVTMSDPVENYEIHIHVNTQGAPFGTSENNIQYFQAIQGIGVIGSFGLDFVPLSIVYCPPGQDMTNSLSQTTTFGTKFTIGNSSSFEADTSVSLKVDFLGLIGEGVGFSNSQSVSNQSTSGVQVSHFRNTVVTADNQRAIGRAYWGPLNDIFVIMVNPSFQVSQRADGSMFYAMQDIQQVLLVPARKMLRPAGDPIAGSIPADVRQKLLQLDPFIVNLNLFFPDTGADLTLAADPFVDPSANNRASIIGRWWLDGGTVVSYSIGETVQLFQQSTNQVNYSSGVTINASAGVNYYGISAALGLGQGMTTTVGLQSSQENDGGYAYNAACFLIKNQNDRDLDGIELYFDKVFSTFMFRRINAEQIGSGGNGGTTSTTSTTAQSVAAKVEPSPPKPRGPGYITGRIRNWQGMFLRGLQMYLTGSDGSTQQTSTTQTGQYFFANLSSGDYTLVAGDQHQKVVVTPECSFTNPLQVDLTNVRRVLDLTSAPVWEVCEALGLTSDAVRKIGSNLQQISREEQLAAIIGADNATVAQWRRSAVFAWPRSAKARQAPVPPPTSAAPSRTTGKQKGSRTKSRRGTKRK